MICDDGNNNAECEYDGGDCCGDQNSYTYCSICQCLEPMQSGCPNAQYKGDGYCDDDNNNALCEYDGGDCCGDNVNMMYCSTCECMDPYYIQIEIEQTSVCQYSWQGDGYCDDVNNLAECNYDNGDCCGDNVNMMYCSACECLDPGYVAMSGQYMNFHVITATDNTGIGNNLVTAYTSSGGYWTGYTDSSGFVHMGPFGYGETVTIEVARSGYDTLVQQFVCSSTMDFIMLGMNPTVSKILLASLQINSYDQNSLFLPPFTEQ